MSFSDLSLEDQAKVLSASIQGANEAQAEMSTDFLEGVEAADPESFNVCISCD